MYMSRAILGAVVSAAFVAGSSSTVQAETYNFRMALGHAPAILYVNLMQNFFAPEVKKRVEAKTPHKVSFVEGYAGSIVKVNETMGSVQTGVVDFGGFCFCFEPPNVPLIPTKSTCPLARRAHNRSASRRARYTTRCR